MKIIDLYNKIANEEEAPKKIKLRAFELERTQSSDIHRLYVDNEGMFFPKDYSFCLDDEVEILEEEKKIPEKLFFTHISNYNEQSVINNNFNNYFKKTKETINQLIDYLKSKGE